MVCVGYDREPCAQAGLPGEAGRQSQDLEEKTLCAQLGATLLLQNRAGDNNTGH